MTLPSEFLWIKFSNDAGETLASIIDRKNEEREGNGGTFLWGLGTALGKPIERLLARTDKPDVLFTPSLGTRPPSPPAPPASIGEWHTAIGLDGATFEIPRFSHVTSGLEKGVPPTKRWALVCDSDVPLANDPAGDTFQSGHLLNLKEGGRPPGPSQTAAVVEVVSTNDLGTKRYRVAFRAQLKAPYLLTLSDWAPVEI